MMVFRWIWGVLYDGELLMRIQGSEYSQSGDSNSERWRSFPGSVVVGFLFAGDALNGDGVGCDAEGVRRAGREGTAVGICGELPG